MAPRGSVAALPAERTAAPAAAALAGDDVQAPVPVQHGHHLVAVNAAVLAAGAVSKLRTSSSVRLGAEAGQMASRKSAVTRW